MKRTARSILLVFLITVLFCNVGQFLPQTKATSTTGSCPQNQILTMTIPSGAPDSFNQLISVTPSDFFTDTMMYLSAYPTPTPTGSLDYNDSMVTAVTANANNTQWSFFVKPGLQWSNGQNVTSQDILNTYSPNFAFNPAYDYVNAHQEVKSETAPNNSVAVFVLNQPDAMFAEKISNLILTPVYPQSFTSQGSNFTGFNTVDVADGPFYVVNYQSGQTQAVLMRNPYFKPLPQVCEILMNYVETDSQIPAYLASSSTDFGPIDPNSAASVLQHPFLHVADEKGLFNHAIGYNVTTYPYNMTQFRQALLFGMNLTQIQQQAYSGYSTLSSASEGGVPPFTKWYSANQNVYSYNQTKASNLLQTIGITKGTDGFLQYPNKTDITLNIWYDNFFAGNTQTAGIIQANLQALGFKVNLNGATRGALIGDSYANTNGINSGMILEQGNGVIWGNAHTDGEPNWNVYMPFAPYPTWINDPVGGPEYQSNLTALESTNNATLEFKYLSNIQSLNAKYLPTIIVNYPDELFGYSTQRFTNWPASPIVAIITWNNTGLADITPISASTASTSTAVSSTPTSSVTSTSISLSTSSGQGNNYPLYAGIVVVVVIAIIAAMLLVRRRS